MVSVSNNVEPLKFFTGLLLEKIVQLYIETSIEMVRAFNPLNSQNLTNFLRL